MSGQSRGVLAPLSRKRAAHASPHFRPRFDQPLTSPPASLLGLAPYPGAGRSSAPPRADPCPPPGCLPGRPRRGTAPFRPRAVTAALNAGSMMLSGTRPKGRGSGALTWWRHEGLSKAPPRPPYRHRQTIRLTTQPRQTARPPLPASSVPRFLPNKRWMARIGIAIVAYRHRDSADLRRLT
jgi:hypothetical protein